MRIECWEVESATIYNRYKSISYGAFFDETIDEAHLYLGDYSFDYYLDDVSQFNWFKNEAESFCKLMPKFIDDIRFVRGLRADSDIVWKGIDWSLYDSRELSDEIECYCSCRYKGLKIAVYIENSLMTVKCMNLSVEMDIIEPPLVLKEWAEDYIDVIKGFIDEVQEKVE